jgi:hypothetical protein
LPKESELEEHGLLLKEFGSFPPAGKKDEPGVWDLAGNVAEWAVAENGKGKILGLSAVSPRDKRCKYTPPPAGIYGIQGGKGRVTEPETTPSASKQLQGAGPKGPAPCCMSA